MSYPLDKPSLQLILDAINRRNRTRLTLADVVITRPVPATTEDAFVNSAITVTGTGTTSYTGPDPVHYRRLDFDTLLAPRDRTFTVANGEVDFTMSDLLPQINTRYGLALTTDDVVDGSWSPSPTDYVDVLLEARDQSYAYIGSSLLRVAPTGGG
jgi:hypothetical protein